MPRAAHRTGWADAGFFQTDIRQFVVEQRGRNQSRARQSLRDTLRLRLREEDRRQRGGVNDLNAGHGRRG